MDSRYLKTLVTAIDSGSFSKAAQALNITQSAVSQRVKTMEEHYGQQLLDRSGASLAATEAGEVVLQTAREILHLENRLEEKLIRLGCNNRLSICCTPAFGITHLPNILNTYMAEYADNTDLALNFQTPEGAISGLHEDSYDIVVIEHLPELNLSQLETISLPQQELVIISSPRLKLPPGKLALSDLLPYTLYVRTKGCSCLHLLERNLANLGSDLGKFKNVIVSDDLHLTVQSVRNGSSIAFVSKALANNLAADIVQQHQIEGFEHRRMLSVARQSNRAACPVVSAFLKGIQDYFDTLDECCIL